ncbi:MAG: two-component system, LytTR family, response regulator [Acidobacteriota bacterium]|jgi:two-component system LytT family response regulator|nr:two-component system, LytTR family, response regulator [Acidobacteriota bacterium]
MAEHVRVVIVDDEPLARQHIADRLAHEEQVEVVGEADNGLDAVEVIRRLRPDIVFLDVQMPGLDGIDVVDTIGADEMPATIFTTAFDQYALKAFDRAAVDYLLKPFDDERFSQAFRRARKTLELKEVDRMARRLRSLLQEEEGERPAPSPTTQYLDRIPVESRGEVRVVPVAKIDYITASGPYAELHVGDQAYAVRERMQTLEERLDPNVFLRVHRSVLVRLDRIDAMLRSPGGDYGVRLKDGTKLSVSRARREELERRLGVTS